jgi:hypothetical protein
MKGLLHNMSSFSEKLTWLKELPNNSAYMYINTIKTIDCSEHHHLYE